MINSDKLVADFCKGDIEAHHFFFRLHADELYRVVGDIISDRKQEKRIVHEVIIKIWYRDNSALKSASDIKALFYRTLRNACTEHLRYKDNDNYIAYRRRVENFTETITEFVSQEESQEIENAGQSVIDQARIVLRLGFSKPISEDEIATRLCMSVGEVTHSFKIARHAISMILQ